MRPRQLVVEGGKKIFHKDMGLGDPIPSEGIKRVNQILKESDLYRYGTPSNRMSEVCLLEKEFAEYLGVKYALAVNSCSSAIFLSLVASGVKPGDKVLIPAVTFTAVPSAVMNVGAIPVLLECNDQYQIDLEDLDKKINPQTRYLLISHMRGHVSDLDRIVKLCRKHKVTIIEDCAHSLGVEWNGKPTGTFGKVSSFSFQSHKIINAGEGGMLVTNDENIAVKAVLLSGCFENWWKKHYVKSDLYLEYLKNIPIYNFRMSNVTAALIRSQLPTVRVKAKKYLRLYKRMEKVLSKCEYVSVPIRDPREKFVPDTIQFSVNGFTKKELGDFMRITKEEGVSLFAFGADDTNVRVFTNWHYLGNIPDLPKTRKMLETACDLRLPVTFTESDINTIGNIIISVLEYIRKSRNTNT